MPTVQTSQNQAKINEKIKALTEKLEQGARDVFTSDKYAAYLQMNLKVSYILLPQCAADSFAISGCDPRCRL